jgi:hypothetical protein
MVTRLTIDPTYRRIVKSARSPEMMVMNGLHLILGLE